MITRTITPHLVRLFKQYLFVTITGPRQAGKTTLSRTWSTPTWRHPTSVSSPRQIPGGFWP